MADILNSSVFKVALVNSTVQRGDYFEFYPKEISGNLINTSYRIVCGYYDLQTTFNMLTDWNPHLSPPSMIVRPGGSLEYKGRVTVRNSKVVRISNARFEDEGTNFSCQLSNFNISPPHYFFDSAILEAVYGEHFL